MSDTQPLVFPDHDYLDTNIVVETNNDQRDEPFTLRGALDLVENLRLIRAEVSEITAGYASLHQELLTEREIRANAQNERDALKRQLAESHIETFELARRILECDGDDCTAEAWSALVEEARRVVTAQSTIS